MPTDPRNLSIRDFTYSLPEDRIANYPLPQRDSSRLLVYEKGRIQNDIFRNIDQHIPPHSVLVFNETRVVEARLLFQKPTGGIIEVFCLEPHESYPDISTALSQHSRVRWLCLIGGASKWKHGQILEKMIRGKVNFLLRAKYIEKRTDNFLIELSWDEEQLSFAEVLHHAGAMPLPPYIRRAPEASDLERYQTIYAKDEGSVAAPTAGLHFTNHVLDKLGKKGIRKFSITLHVGAGTFKPVKSATMKDHEMHSEFIDVPLETIEGIRNHLHQKIVAVGTTSLRALETLYWLGIKSASSPEIAEELTQWEAYELDDKGLNAGDTLERLITLMKKNKLKRLRARTQIFIAPGYRTRIANALITNFHQPQSTLLLLVAALIGDDWRKVYEHALGNDYRFLSYGDSCLLSLPNPSKGGA